MTPPWLESLRRFWAGEGFDPAQKPLLIALSGGCDSVALLELFQREFVSHGCRLFAVHINHHLREESDTDQAFVEKLCRTYDIPLAVETLNPASRATGESIEMWGREHRYAAFDRARKKFNADFVLTAHHRDDAVETFCLRLLRGTGFAGLAGIPFRRQNVIRPLLPVSRLELKEWLVACGASWREDASNTDVSIPRNWVRHVLLPGWRAREPEVETRIYGIVSQVAKLRPAWERLMAETYPLEELRLRGGIPLEWLRDDDADAALLRHLLPALGVDKPAPELLSEILRQSRSASSSLRVRVDESTVLTEKNNVLVSLRSTKPQ